MNLFYIDLETKGTPTKLNPHTDTLLSIQYQEIWNKTWTPKGELTILKAWEIGEKQAVKQFKEKFFPNDEIPRNIVFGHAIHYDKEMLRVFMKRFLDFDKFTAWDFLNRWFSIDTRDITVFLNNGMIKGSGLSNWTKKSKSGYSISALAENKEYSKIEKYIRNETSAYLEFLRTIRKRMSGLSHNIRRDLGLQ